MANTVKAIGQLKHHFWGKYFATVVLGFEDEQAALDALKVLGEPWKQAEKSKIALGCFVNQEQLNDLKDQLEKYGADKSKIDSCAKSIDYGERFQIVVPVIPGEQLEFGLV